jgi:hypothetical protein
MSGRKGSTDSMGINAALDRHGVFANGKYRI